MRDVMRVVTDSDGVRVELKAERQSEASRVFSVGRYKPRLSTFAAPSRGDEATSLAAMLWAAIGACLEPIGLRRSHRDLDRLH